MRLSIAMFAALLLIAAAPAQQPAAKPRQSGAATLYRGFDRNDYPGDDVLPALRRQFSFAGYWLNNPPGARQNSWLGKRETLLRAGFGFLVLFNGRLDAEIVKAQRSGTSPAALGRSDAAAATAAARREHFPARTLLFLDQEEGGRLLPEQAAYLFAWTDAVGRSGFRPGVYASGQTVNEGHGQTITTAQDIRSHVMAEHLSHIALWIAQDACPPSNGCTMQTAAPASSGTPDAAVWQYAQSPRRKAFTSTCARTYAANNNCYVPGVPRVYLDLDAAESADPSHGR